MKSAPLAFLAIALLSATCALAEQQQQQPEKDLYYTVERLSDPAGAMRLEVGGMNFDADGTLYVGTRRGEVWSLKDGKWTRFASGLAECLGVLPVERGVVLATQRPEVTRLVDGDGDGVAERYEDIADNFAYSGNYHDFNFGLVRDGAGNLYGALNLSHTNHDPWGGQYMGSDVKDRGTVYRISPKGEYSTFAWGVRSPNGVTISPDGEIIAAESQGEFTATNCLHHIREGGFYGHPASLSFKPGFTGNPQTTTIEDLARLRTVPIVNVPYNRLGKSITEPRYDTTAGKFGPFAGQIFAGDTNSPIITRIFLEKVGGELQGACFPFLTHRDLEGSNRIAFGPDGAMYVGLTNRGWAAGTHGLRRIKWTGETPLEIQKVELQPDGFLLTFTRPVNREQAGDVRNYQMLHYRYAYHAKYGSDEFDKTPVQPTAAAASPDGKSVRLTVAGLLPMKMYQIEVQNVAAADDGSPLRNSIAWYTLNRLNQQAAPGR